MPDVTKPRPKTDNASLKAALTIQTGEGAARVTVTKEGKDVGYLELERMKLKDLLDCKIEILSIHAAFVKDERSYIGQRDGYNYFWAAFGGTEIRARYPLEERAVKVLEDAYTLAVAAVSGGM